MPIDDMGSAPHDTLKVEKARWLHAQRWEQAHWVATQKKRAAYGKNLIWGLLSIVGLKPKHRGDDWNQWWLERFNHYSFLPKSVERAIELGCGPYTNMRLITQNCQAEHLFLSDPLMKTYVGFRQTYLAELYRRGFAYLDDNSIEDCPFTREYFDLTVMINVLDHVRDAEACVNKAIEITKQGGFIIIGQDLSNQEDIEKLGGAEGDVGHPIRVHHTWLDDLLLRRFEVVQRDVIPRSEGRAPGYHYGTYLFAGVKRD